MCDEHQLQILREPELIVCFKNCIQDFQAKFLTLLCAILQHETVLDYGNLAGEAFQQIISTAFLNGNAAGQGNFSYRQTKRCNTSCSAQKPELVKFKIYFIFALSVPMSTET